MEDLTDLTLENEELKKEIKQMRAEMDKMSESMRIMEKQNAEGTSTVKQMTQMFEAMQKSAEKRSMVDTTETAATPDYPPGFTQGLMPVTVHLNKPVQQVDPPEVQWPLYGLPPNYAPPIVNNASDQTAKPQGSDAKVADSQTPHHRGSAAAVLGVTPAQNVQWFPWQQATNFGMPNQSMVFGAATGEGKSIEETQLRLLEERLKVGLMGTSLEMACVTALRYKSHHRRLRRVQTNATGHDGQKVGAIGCGGNIVDVSVIDYSASTSPKPLVVHYTRDAAVRTTNRPIPITIQVPTSFPYKDNKAYHGDMMWKFSLETDRTTQSSEVIKEKEKGKEMTSQKEITEETRKEVPKQTTSFQALEIAHATYEKPIVESQPSDALMMVARVMLENGYQYGRGLGRYGQGVSRLPDFMGKQDKFGLGYKPSNADVKMFVEEKEEKRLARLGGREPRTGGVPICDIRESFISAGFEHSNLIAAAEGHTQGDVNNNWVRVGPPDAKLPNWEIVELPVIFNFK
ncbi:G-patch domain [Sesbania bispinosa]|nr:G-patch domain [Sesbania bispinosa]